MVNDDEFIHKRDFDASLDISKTFFDFKDFYNEIFIYDYTWFDSDIEFLDNGEKYKITKKEKETIEDIKKLFGIIVSLVDYAIEKSCDALIPKNNTTIYKEIVYGHENEPIPIFDISNYHFDLISDEEKVLIINQVMFDIFYEKYKSDSELMSLNKYCENICKTFPELTVANFNEIDESEGETNADRVKSSTDTLSKVIKREIIKKSENLKLYLDCQKEENFERTKKYIDGEKSYNDYIRLGIDPSEAVKIMNFGTNGNKQKISKFHLDTLFFRSVSIPNLIDGEIKEKLIICSKQSKRKYGQNSNNTYTEFIFEHNEYDRFVEMLIQGYNNSSKEYFTKTMDLYHLELNQRIDYIYKLSTRLQREKAPKIDKEFLYSVRYTPTVYRPIVTENNKIEFYEVIEYYTPMLYLDEYFQNFDVKNEKQDTQNKYVIISQARAIALELFKYHYSFKSENYDEIKKYISIFYDVISYHDNDKLWKYTENFTTQITNEALDKINETLLPSSKDTKDEDSVRRLIKKFIKRNEEVNNSIFYPRIEGNK